MGTVLGRWVDYYCQARHDGHGRYRAARCREGGGHPEAA